MIVFLQALHLTLPGVMSSVQGSALRRALLLSALMSLLGPRFLVDEGATGSVAVLLKVADPVTSSFAHCAMENIVAAL